jgi:type II secretory pathway pseudopilin PulG
MGVLATIVLVAVNPEQQFKKARDAQRLQHLRAIKNALQAYYTVTRTMPPNRTPGAAYWSTSSDWLQELKDGGYLKEVPKDPKNSAPYIYGYYNYGVGNSTGALVVAGLEAIEPTTDTTGIMPDSCRPWTGTNWCRSDLASTQLCLCAPY